MTIEEAEKLMCPFGNDCVAYQCMAWRWFDAEIKNEATAVWRARRGRSDGKITEVSILRG